MLSKGRWHWLQPAAQDNIGNLSLAVVLRHAHYIESDQSFSSAIHKLPWICCITNIQFFKSHSFSLLISMANEMLRL